MQRASLSLRNPKRIEGVERPAGFVVGTVTLTDGVPAERLQQAIDSTNLIVGLAVEESPAAPPEAGSSANSAGDAAESKASRSSRGR